jgi:predicted NAD-dependent protein-ADP-ribosyltransferase YbiA (DUF1768 family)
MTKMLSIDIGSKENPELSNFNSFEFWFDGVLCGSMEGLLQSFKFENAEKQREVCKLVGIKAKYKGKKRNKAWKSQQTLWWKGVPYKRDCDEYQKLLDKSFDSLSMNKNFRDYLLDTGDAILTHDKYGSWDITKTVLTREEFCDRLIEIRRKLRIHAMYFWK